MRWNFPVIGPDRVESDPTQAEFFNNNEVDRNQSLVREVCQNSLDAGLGAAVTVIFRISEAGIFPSEMDKYISTLKPHLSAVGVDLGITQSPAKFLLIEDFGTRGLTGDLESKDEGNFALFWRRYGKSEKGGSQRGRWGLGKTVYPNSSRISSFFGLTIRDSDKAKCLLGQAMLGSHEVGSIRYDPYGTFSASEAGVIQMPSTSAEDLNHFNSTFNLTRSNESGLSIVVPYLHDDLNPESLKRAAIEHYFFPILEGKLVIKVNETTIDNTTIKDVASNTTGLPKNMATLFEFTEEVIKKSGKPDYVLEGYDPQSYGSLRDSDIEPEALASLKEAYESGKLVSVLIPVRIAPKNSPQLDSSVELFLQNDPNLERGGDFYIRGGIAVSGNKSFSNTQALGIMLANDKPICEFLGDAENPAHTQWTEASDRLNKKYDQPRKTLRYIKRVLNDLLGLLGKTGDKRDDRALQNIFFLPKRDAGVTPGSKKPGNAPVIDSRPQPFKITRKQRGFAVRANPDCAIMPPEAKIMVAYSIRRGNPFKKFNPLDFDLTDSSFTITQANASRVLRSPNVIKIKDPTHEFVLNVDGFDPHRDLEILIVNTTEGDHE